MCLRVCVFAWLAGSCWGLRASVAMGLRGHQPDLDVLLRHYPRVSACAISMPWPPTRTDFELVGAVAAFNGVVFWRSRCGNDGVVAKMRRHLQPVLCSVPCTLQRAMRCWLLPGCTLWCASLASLLSILHYSLIWAQTAKASDAHAQSMCNSRSRSHSNSHMHVMSHTRIIPAPVHQPSVAAVLHFTPWQHQRTVAGPNMLLIPQRQPSLPIPPSNVLLQNLHTTWYEIVLNFETVESTLLAETKNPNSKECFPFFGVKSPQFCSRTSARTRRKCAILLRTTNVAGLYLFKPTSPTGPRTPPP